MSDDNWKEEYFERERAAALKNDSCQKDRWWTRRQPCPNKAKYIMILSEINGAWSIIVCQDCMNTFKESDKDPNHSEYDCDSAIAAIEPLDPRLSSFS